MRRWAMIGAILSALGLAGCKDNYRITHVNQYPGYARSYITAGGRVAVDLHGLPLQGMTAQEAIERLSMPHDFPAGVRFSAAGADTANRLVLVFNGGSPDAARMCREHRRASTAAPDAKGFSVSAAYCSGAGPLSVGYLVAPDATTEDPKQYPRLMRQLFAAMFAETERHSD